MSLQMEKQIEREIRKKTEEIDILNEKRAYLNKNIDILNSEISKLNADLTHEKAVTRWEQGSRSIDKIYNGYLKAGFNPEEAKKKTIRDLQPI